MASNQAVAERWADVVVGRERRYLNGSRTVLVYGDKLYSYGSHFELARFVRPQNAAKHAPFFLLNGDTYSVSTNRHQRLTRDAVARHALYASLIVPHSAMRAAGIDMDSIEPIDIEPERVERPTHRVNVPGLRELAYRVADGAFGWDRSGTDADKERGTYTLSQRRGFRGEDGAQYSVTAWKRGYDYSAPSVRDCGACGGTGRIVSTLSRATDGYVPCGHPGCNDGRVETLGAWVDYSPAKLAYYRNGSELRHVGDDIDSDTFEYSGYRHFLGAAVFRATVRETVERPCTVHADPASYGEGDAFCAVCRGHRDNRNPAIRVSMIRTAYFLSAFDENESHPHYFLCELPANAVDGTPNRPTTVAAALESLRPFAVLVADRSGAEVQRQGDVFAIPTNAHERYPIAFAHAERDGIRGITVPLDGTGSHRVRELVKVTSVDGKAVRYFARGWIRHDEHRAVKLDTWHELVRNRVPLAKGRTRGDGARFAMLAGTPRAWSIIGNVD